MSSVIVVRSCTYPVHGGAKITLSFDIPQDSPEKQAAGVKKSKKAVRFSDIMINFAPHLKD